MTKLLERKCAEFSGILQRLDDAEYYGTSSHRLAQMMRRALRTIGVAR